MEKIAHQCLVTKLHIRKIMFAGDPNFWGNIFQLAQIDVLVTLQCISHVEPYFYIAYHQYMVIKK
jgi:hypothetical protein